MGIMQNLGDFVASGFTGQNTKDVIDKAQLMRAQVQDIQAQVPLRGAQTQEALAKADTERTNALKASHAEEARARINDAYANSKTPSLGDLMMAGYGNYGDVTGGQGHLQDQGLVSQISDPNSTPQQQIAAEQGLTHKVVNPYQALPADSVDLRNLAPPGSAPVENISQVGHSEIGKNNATEALTRTKTTQLNSTDDNINPDELAFHAHSVNNGGPPPAFGMGQSKLRTAFLKAQYLDAAGIPITRDSLGLAAPKGPATAATPAVATPPVTAGTAVGTAPPAAPLSPQDAAEHTVARRTDVKAAQGAIANTTKMLTTVNAQEKTAAQSYDLAMSYANKVGADGSPIINKALIAWNTGAKGDKETSQFVSALQIAHDEYAKIMSGATGAAGLTDAGRAAADKLFNHSMNLDTLKGIGQVMRIDAGNRRTGYVGAIADARRVISGDTARAPAASGAADAAPAAATLPPAARAALKENVITHFGNGQSWTLKDGQPVQVK